jgi:Fe-S-cluster-containing dehydrogenase component
MNERVLFFLPGQCSGCGICQMACSLHNAGRCSVADAHIRILKHPRLGTAVVAVDTACEKCATCVDSCNLEAIRFTPEAEWGGLLKEGWIPSPVLEPVAPALPETERA